ncbi:MAG TPA: iron-sulfur cluster assembly protein [Ignavibacteria bacterium]|nr:iron-sulfur cluster assembly protein [Ignavibacteria bacterium]
MSDENKTEKAVNIEVIKEEVIKILKNCYDPEIPVNIYDLGLIYDIKIATNGDVLVIMTLTSPACPVAGSLPSEVQEKLREHPMIHDARVEITFDPPWDFNKMSDEAKLELGFL